MNMTFSAKDGEHLKISNMYINGFTGEIRPLEDGDLDIDTTGISRDRKTRTEDETESWIKK